MVVVIEPGFRPEVTSHGRYKCPYCNHPVYKTHGGALEHIKSHHYNQAETSELRSEIKRLKEEKSSLNTQLLEAKKPKRAPEKKEDKYYQAVVYCTNCTKMMKCGMPKGILVQNVTHSECGNQTLHLITNAREWGVI